MQKIIVFRQSTTSLSNSNGLCNSNSRTPLRPISSSVTNEAYIRKAQVKTLRILFITVVAFFICWLPYYGTLLFYVCNRELATRVVPFWVYKLAELSAVSNACLNPFIYGNYLLKIKYRFRCCRKK